MIVKAKAPPIKKTFVAGRGAPNAPILIDSSDLESSPPLAGPLPRTRPRGRLVADSTSPALAATTFRRLEAQPHQDADGYSLASLSLGGLECDTDGIDDADGGFHRALLQEAGRGQWS